MARRGRRRACTWYTTEEETEEGNHSLLSMSFDQFQARQRWQKVASKQVRVLRLPQAFREKVQQEISDILDHDIINIEHSLSDWVLLIFPLQKADGTLRIYRRLNSVSR